MRKRKCGCYDGPYSEQMPKTMVSVRCQAHKEELALRGHSLMVLGTDGRTLVETRPVAKLDGYQSLRTKQINQAKRYGGSNKVE